MADILKDKGNEAFKEKNYKEADRLYASAAQLDPSNAVLYSNRAMALIKLDDWESCISVCETGLQQSPDSKTSVKLFWRRGIAQAKLQDLPSAKISYEHALKIDANNTMVNKSMEELLAIESQVKRSHSIDEKSSEKRPKTVESIPIYEVDELPAEFRDPSIATPSTKSAAATSSPTPTPSVPSPVQSTPSVLIQDISTSAPTRNALQSFPDSPTLHQFTTIMKSPSPQSYSYIFNLSPETYSKIFSTGCIEPAVLNVIFDASLYNLIKDPTKQNSSIVIDLLNTLSSVPRFSLVYLFCDKSKFQQLHQALLNIKDIDVSQLQHVLKKWNY